MPHHFAAVAADPVACFAVLAEAGPHSLPRVLEPLAKRGLFPSRCHAVHLPEEGDDMSIDLQVVGMTEDQAALVAAAIGQVVGVRSVLTSQRIGRVAA